MATSACSQEAEERLQRVQAVTDPELAHLQVEDMLDVLLDRLFEALDVDGAGFLLLDSISNQLQSLRARGSVETLPVRTPVIGSFVEQVIAEKRPLVSDQSRLPSSGDSLLTAVGARSLLAVPLLARAQVLGVGVVTSATRSLGEEDVAVLELVSDRVALAVSARLASREQAAASALQRSHLPDRLPDVVGLEFAARYVSAGAGVAGGDWYDVFVLPSGHVCVVMGDVVGHGLTAAVVMSRLRAAMRAYALDDEEPASVLTRLNRESLYFEPDSMATVLYAIFDPSLDRVHVSSAGHPAPILAPRGQPATLLGIPADPPIGVTAPGRRRTTAVEIPPGAILYLFTDGLVEGRTSSLDSGLNQLRARVRAAHPEVVCAETMAHVSAKPPDDVAVLVIRRRGDKVDRTAT